MASRRGPDNSARVSVSGIVANALPFANIFHVQLSTSSSIIQADLDAWLVLFTNAYKTRFDGHISNSSSVTLGKAVLYTPGGGELISTDAPAGAGSGGTIVQDASACEVISWRSTVYWRGGKPRTYLPGVPVANITGANALTVAEITALTTAAAGFRTDVNALTQGTITGTQLGFISFRTGNADRVPPVFFPFTGATIHGRLGSQKRRLGKWLN